MGVTPTSQAAVRVPKVTRLGGYTHPSSLLAPPNARISASTFFAAASISRAQITDRGLTCDCRCLELGAFHLQHLLGAARRCSMTAYSRASRYESLPFAGSGNSTENCSLIAERKLSP